MVVTVSVDARQAIAKFSPAGIPTAVRNNLRRVLPDLTKRLGALVESKLDSGLKTRRRLVVKKELVENPTAVYGRVRTISTSEPFLLPLWLEEGTKPHTITGNPLLWFRTGKAFTTAAGKLIPEGTLISKHEVKHPGFAGIHYTRDAFAEMESEIRLRLEDAVKLGAREA